MTVDLAQRAGALIDHIVTRFPLAADLAEHARTEDEILFRLVASKGSCR